MPTFDPTNYEGQDRLSHIEKYLTSPNTDSLVRQQIVMSARGFVSCSIAPPELATGITALTASFASGVAVGLRKGDVVSNIVTYIATAQAPTQFQGGLFDRNGTHLAHTASLGASIVGSAFWVAPLTSTVTITADDVYYSVVLSSGTATQPALSRAIFATNACNSIGSGIPTTVKSSAAIANLQSNVSLVKDDCAWFMAVS